MVTMNINPDMMMTDSEDEPDSPVYALTTENRFHADLIIADPLWLDQIDQNTMQMMTKAILACLDAAEAADPVEMSILLTDDAAVAELNQAYRGKDGATNVLSFPDDDGGVLGDIALARETVVQEAQDLARPLSSHVLHLVIHGVLHLLGHDHIDDADAEIMESLETHILAGFGIADPYEEAR